MLQITIFLYSGLIISSLCANIYSTYNVEKYELNEYLWDCSPRSSFANTYIVEGTFFMFLVGFYNTIWTQHRSLLLGTYHYTKHWISQKATTKTTTIFFYFISCTLVLFFSSLLFYYLLFLKIKFFK